MGCQISELFSEQVDFHDPQLAATGISISELEWLHKIFISFSFKRRDTIDIEGLLLGWDVGTNELCRKALNLFDRVKKSKRMSFKEFVLVIWHICTISQYAMGFFLLEIFDESRVGILETRPLMKCLHALKVPDVYINM